jgi:ribonuclease Z
MNQSAGSHNPNHRRAWLAGALAAALGVALVATAARPRAADPAEPQAPLQSAGYPLNYYFPNTEALAQDEMRVVALGTGMPGLRRAQASSSWLVELGNGDKFLFDVGTGSQSNFAMLQIYYSDITAVFLSHLHTDHAGDLPAMWINSWLGGRLTPIEIYGPSGATPELGTGYFVEHMKKMFNWDITSRHGKLPAAGADITVHEFDHARTHVVYEKNGVRISSWPALHIIDGPVSFRLEWNGRSFVFSGDTAPNKWFVENAQHADLVVHETFPTVDQLVRKQLWDRKTATVVGTVIHTSPAAAGRIFSMTRPRHAVGYHFYNDFDTGPEVEAEVRTTYDGPLTLADDMMVFNVTAEAIRVRTVVGPTRTWLRLKDPQAWHAAKRGPNAPLSDWYREGALRF